MNIKLTQAEAPKSPYTPSFRSHRTCDYRVAVPTLRRGVKKEIPILLNYDSL